MKTCLFILSFLLVVTRVGLAESGSIQGNLAAVRLVEEKVSESAWKLISADGARQEDSYKVAVYEGWLFMPSDNLSNEVKYVYIFKCIVSEHLSSPCEIVLKSKIDYDYCGAPFNATEAKSCIAQALEGPRLQLGVDKIYINNRDMIFAYRVLFEPMSPEKEVIIIYLDDKMNEVKRRTEKYDNKNYFLTTDLNWRFGGSYEIWKSMPPTVIAELEQVFDVKSDYICLNWLIELPWAKDSVVCCFYTDKGRMRLVRQNGAWNILSKCNSDDIDAKVLSSIFKQYPVQSFAFTNKMAVVGLQVNIARVCEGELNTLLPRDFPVRTKETMLWLMRDGETREEAEEFIKKYRYDPVAKCNGNKFEMKFNFISSTRIIWEYYIWGEYDKRNKSVTIEKIRIKRLLEDSPYFRMW